MQAYPRYVNKLLKAPQEGRASTPWRQQIVARNPGQPGRQNNLATIKAGKAETTPCGVLLAAFRHRRSQSEWSLPTSQTA